MPKKIGTDFHMVANDIYQAYDEGEKPQEKDLTELYELSKEFVKEYEERKEKDMIKLNKCGDDKSIPKETHDKIKSCTNSIMDFDQDVKWYDVYSMFEEIFKDGKKIVSTEKVVFLNDEEHEFLVEELGENRIRSQELLDDEEPYEGTYLGENIDGYKREVRLFDAVLKKLATKKGETND